MGSLCSTEKKEHDRNPLTTLGIEKKTAIEMELSKGFDSPLHPTSFNVLRYTPDYHSIENWVVVFRITNRYQAVVCAETYDRHCNVKLTVYDDKESIVDGTVFLKGEVRSSFYHKKWDDELCDEDLYELIIHCVVCCSLQKVPPQEIVNIWKSRATKIKEHHRYYMEESKSNGYTDIQGLELTIYTNNRSQVASH